MNRKIKSHKIIATFFLLIFLPTLFPTRLYAGSNVISPESTSFEAVDSTDMVNLLTGDMSYVLPLLNVPSPEGGYPLSLSYHAGIAMDQESSWVGLGWSLNAGAINRSVKGVPDDWGKTRRSELLYDEGESLDFYNFNIGGTLPNGITVGMSSSWGAYKAWGGTVGYGGLNVSFGSDDIGVGVGGVGYNYNKNSGSSLSVQGGNSKIGGGLGYNLSSGTFSANTKYNSLGISFDSSGISGVSIGGSSGIVLSNATEASKGDYYYKQTTEGASFKLGNFFWVGYQHANIEYSLFLLNNNYVSGTLNLYDTKKVSNRVQDDKYYMDVKDYGWGSVQSYGWSHLKKIHVLYPNYDNYSVSAQGISGSISPKIFDEVRLYGKGNQNPLMPIVEAWQNYEHSFDFISEPSSTYDNQYKLNNKIHFYFDNVNSSFLRTQVGDFKYMNNPDVMNTSTNSISYTAYIDINDVPSGENYFVTETDLLNNVVNEVDNTFSSPYTEEGFQKRVGNKKRDGNVVETFTNEELYNNAVAGFIESPGYDRLKYSLIAPKGIGAYRVTTIDGKTYHYSLPVYNYEQFSKNYMNVNNENEKFIETFTTSPYATHWLLTAVTGPDYIDFNNNKIVDEGDYGYWVDFDYGKWSDGYGWRTPTKKIGNNYTYSWGRKEIYYLDKIKTRTHTALFVKSTKDDNRGVVLEYGKRNQNGNLLPYVAGNVPYNITERFTDKKIKEVENDIYTRENPEEYYHSPQQFSTNTKYKHSTFKYVKLPMNFTLKLDKIILLKNSDAVNVNKDLSVGQFRWKGYTYFDFGFTKADLFGSENGLYRQNPGGMKVSNIHSDQNVLEASDIAVYNNTNSSLESKALKVIDMIYDNSLCKTTPQSVFGKLTLKKVDFRGKANSSVLPPYVFKYNEPEILYDFDNSDNWGFVKENPDAWSLSEIITPVGSKIKITYESDSFKKEAINNSYKSTYIQFKTTPDLPDKIINFTVNGNLITIDFDNVQVAEDLTTRFLIDDILKLNYTYKVKTSPTYLYNSQIKAEVLDYKIVSVNNISKTVVIELADLADLNLHTELVSTLNCEIDNLDLSSADSPYWAGDPTAPVGTKCMCKVAFTVDLYHPRDGGGVRVKKIVISSTTDNQNLITEYSYVHPATNLTSGSTSYEPKDIQNQLYFVEEFPGPGVIYEHVEVAKKYNLEVLMKAKYQFNTFDNISLGAYSFEGDDDIIVSDKIFTMNTKRLESNNKYFNKITIEDRFSSVGSIKSIETVNKLGQIINSTQYHYKYLDKYSQNQGIVQESFKYMSRDKSIYRWFNPNDNFYYYNRLPFYGIHSISKITYANVLEKVITNNGAYTDIVYYNKYDFLTGQVLETTSTSSEGLMLKTRTIPAYKKYSSMGSKVDNINNKNMLTQNAATISYIRKNAGDAWRQTGVGITTWNNIWTYKDIGGNSTSPNNDKEKIWRKHKSYVWNGLVDSEGIFLNYDAGNDEDGFDWSVGIGIQHSRWKILSENTLFDHFSMPLESKDINGNLASTKMGNSETEVTVSGNAGYNEMFYSGMENIKNNYWLEPEVRLVNAIRELNTDLVHTGKYSVKTTSASELGVFMRNGQHQAGKYKLSVWIHKDNVSNAKLRIWNNSITLPFSNESYSAGNWVLKTAYFDVSANDFYVFLNSVDGSPVYYDDLMIRPVASSINGYVYNEWGELSSIISNNGLATKFEYDDGGRLVKTYVEIVGDPANGMSGGFKLAKANKIKYKNL